MALIEKTTSRLHLGPPGKLGIVGSTVRIGKKKLAFQAVGQTPAKFPHELGHKRTKLQRSIFVAGILKVLESLVYCSLVHNSDNTTLVHVEPRNVTCVVRYDNLSLRIGVRFVPA
jgi:hypothetical protein